VVMMIIPFGLVGAIWGHVAWDVPLSLFSVVGLIGMTGIIINDSIVLISTVDEYAKNRGLVPAIIDATCDRLRPVMLTTATTVLGLTPLLFERSQDAQFLKPTIITLVYGLGFGMFLVLFLVPAVLAMGQDLGRFFIAYRRGARTRTAGPVRTAIWVASLGTLAIFAATLGSWIAQTALWAPLQSLLGSIAQSPSAATAVALFVAGTALWVILVNLGASVTIALMRNLRNRRAVVSTAQ